MIQPQSQDAPSQFQYRRMPAVPRTIATINPETDIRVRILGRVIDKFDGTIVMDDGSATTEIVVENLNVETGKLVRVFCRVMPLESGFELRAEIVQDMDSLDVDLYKKIQGQ